MITAKQYDAFEKEYQEVWKELRGILKQEKALQDRLWYLNRKLREPIQEEENENEQN